MLRVSVKRQDRAIAAPLIPPFFWVCLGDCKCYWVFGYLVGCLGVGWLDYERHLLIRSGVGVVLFGVGWGL